MPRLVRHRLAFFIVDSLLLCLAAAGLWVRSHVVGDTWYWGESRYRDDRGVLSQRTVVAYSCAGEMGLWWDLTVYRVAPERTAILDQYFRTGFRHTPDLEPRRFLGTPMLSRWGFRAEEFDRPGLDASIPGRSRGTSVAVPHWLVVLTTGVAPTWWVVRARRGWRRGRRRRDGRCACCGYDVRATPSRCPECRTPDPGNG